MFSSSVCAFVESSSTALRASIVHHPLARSPYSRSRREKIDGSGKLFYLSSWCGVSEVHEITIQTTFWERASHAVQGAERPGPRRPHSLPLQFEMAPRTRSLRSLYCV